MWSVQDITASDGRHGNRYHTWKKPDELARRLVVHASSEYDKILDPFTCTGTFVLASARLNRIPFGCDISLDSIPPRRGGEPQKITHIPINLAVFPPGVGVNR